MEQRTVGRPKKSLEQKRNERVVTLLTTEEKQRLKAYTGEQSISGALRKAANIILSPIEREGKIDRLSNFNSFMWKVERALKKGDIELTIESRNSIIKLRRGHIFFEIPQKTVKKEIAAQIFKELEQRCQSLKEGPLVAEFIFQDDRFKYVTSRVIEISGYERERLLNKSVFDLVYPDDRERVKAVVQEGLKRRGIPLQFKFRVLRNDGEIIYVNASAIPIEYEGRPAFVGSFVDLTEWNELQQELGRLERIIGAPEKGRKIKSLAPFSKANWIAN